MITTLVFSPSDMSGLLIQADASISPENAANYGPTLLATALKYQINTPLRLAHWLAQLLFESGSLKYTEELASGSAYENRRSLGNTQRGDGRRYKGRGLFQITGKFNYNRYGKFAGFDAVAHPERLATLPYAVDSAGWFWTHGTPQDLNRIADKDNVVLVTKLINGGHNGLASRRRHLSNAKEAIDPQGIGINLQPAQIAIGSTLHSHHRIPDRSAPGKADCHRMLCAGIRAAIFPDGLPVGVRRGFPRDFVQAQPDDFQRRPVGGNDPAIQPMHDDADWQTGEQCRQFVCVPEVGKIERAVHEINREGRCADYGCISRISTSVLARKQARMAEQVRRKPCRVIL